MAHEDPNGELGVLINGELHIVAGVASVSFKFLQYMLALKRNGRLTESGYTDLKQFQVDTNGEYTIYNIPTQNPKLRELFKEQLKAAGVAFCELPDLNVRDGVVQLAIRNRDVAKWQYVLDEFLMGRLTGGQFSLKELQAMTGGQYDIVSVGIGDGTLEISRTADLIQDFIGQCFADPSLVDHIPIVLKNNPVRLEEYLQSALLKDPEKLKEVKGLIEYVWKDSNSDLREAAKELAGQVQDTLDNTWMLRGFLACLDQNQVNYAVMPDLRFSDGKTQFALVPSDRERFKKAVHEFEGILAKQAAMEAGHPLDESELPLVDVSSMDYEEYRDTSEVPMHEYLKNKDADTKESIEKVLQESKEQASPKTENFRYALEQDQAAKDPARADIPETLNQRESMSKADIPVAPYQRETMSRTDIPVIGNQREQRNIQEVPVRQNVYRVAESGPGADGYEQIGYQQDLYGNPMQNHHMPSKEHVELYMKYMNDYSFEMFSLPPEAYRDFKESYNMAFVRLQDTDNYVAVVSFIPDEKGLRCFVEPEREYSIFRFDNGVLKRCADTIVGSVLSSEIAKTLMPAPVPKGFKL